MHNSSSLHHTKLGTTWRHQHDHLQKTETQPPLSRINCIIQVLSF